MEKLRDLEIELESIYDALFDDEDPTDLFGGLSKEERKKHKERASELEKIIDEIYKEKKKALENKHPELKSNSNFQKLYSRSERSNYIILSYFVKHLSLCENPKILEELELFIYDCHTRSSIRRTYHKDVKEKISKLSALQPAFFQHEAFVKYLNDFRFGYLDEYFETKEIMRNKKFVNFLLSIVNDSHFLEYDEYHHISGEMISALKEGLDTEFIFSMGNKKRYKSYLSRYTKEELLNIILNIKSMDVKKKLLADTFNIVDTSKLLMLLEFINFEDVRLQLLDENSFYYELLIKPLLIKRDKDNALLDNDYASISSVVYFNIEDFNDFEFNKMIHHFDRLTKHYIYFYFENEVKRVPVLFFIQTMRRKIDLWIALDTFPYSIEVTDEENEYFQTYFKDYIDRYFEDIAIEALEENIGKCLSKDDEAYWDYLLSESVNYDDEGKKLELENTI